MVVERPAQVVTETYDGVFLVWVLNQTIEKIPSSLNNIFEGNIFYPHKNVMAYSDLLVPSALLSALPVKITGQPQMATSVMLILGQILSLLVVYFWWLELSGSPWAAFLGSAALGLSQIRFTYYVHLQMWTMQWWLITSWMLWRFFKNGRVWQLYLGGAFLVLQVWESLLPVFFIGVVGTILLAQNWDKLKGNWKHFIVVGLLVLGLSLPVVRAYWGVSREFDYQRPIREVAHFSASVDDLWGSFLAPGLYILFVAALVKIGKKSVLKDKKLVFLLALFAVGIIMFLGPALKWQGKTVKVFGDIPIPLPYALAYYLIPGFGALRTPSRWIWLSAWAASGAVALGFSKYKFRKVKELGLLLAAGVIAVFAGTHLKKVYEIPMVEEYPKIYKWLESQPGKVVIELPMYTWGAGEIASREVYRMVFSLEHKKYLINGYSGFFPPEWERLAADLWTGFPSSELEDKLKERGVNYIIVHKDEYPEDKIRQIEEWGSSRLIWEDEKTCVYRL